MLKWFTKEFEKINKVLAWIDKARKNSLTVNCLDTDFETECETAPDKYYKTKRVRHFGMCGFKWEYKKATKFSPMQYRFFKGIESNMNIHCFATYGDGGSNYCMYFKSVNSIEVSEQEYMEATKNDKHN